MSRIHAVAAGLFLLLAPLTGCGEGQAVPGDPTHFDPIARYDAMAAFAGSGLKLRQLSARGVREDGSVDLEESRYHTGVQYHFAKASPVPPDAPPVGAGGAANWHQRVLVILSKAGHVGEESDEHGTRQVVSKGMRRVEMPPEAGPVRPHSGAPKCSLADLWDKALEAGAPAGAVANVEYKENVYSFRVSDIGFVLEFDESCALRGD